MNVKYFLLFAVLLLFVMAANAQNQEPTDSLTRELQEVVVNAKQPATKLVGTTLVSTIPCRHRHCSRCACAVADD